jgi:stage II sporulation protein AA (anti-sigma F factor antagonist)
MAGMKKQSGGGAWLSALDQQGDELVVEVGGELDLSSVGPLESALSTALERKPSRVVFQVRELTFMDSSGIALLVATAQRVPQVELRYASPMIRRVIELAGLSSTLPITS